MQNTTNYIQTMIPKNKLSQQKKTAFVLPENAKDFFKYAGCTEEKLSEENIVVPVIVIRLLFLMVNNVSVFWVIHPKDHTPINFVFVMLSMCNLNCSCCTITN